MTQNLDRMTNAELKQYLSAHRNDEEAFRVALKVLIERCDPNTLQPYPFKLANPESEVEAILREKLNASQA